MRFATIVLASMAVVSVSWSKTKPTEDDWRWLDQYRRGELEAQMPMSADLGMFVSFRSYRDLYHDVHERYFQIRFVPQERTAVAEIVKPIRRSIQEQLLRFHMRNRALTVDEIRPRLRIKRSVVSEDACPAVRKQLDDLRGVEFRVPSPGLVIIHPTVFEVELGIGGGHVAARLIDMDQPLVQWAQATLEALESCVNN